LTSKQYVKRIWRIPKDRGAPECFGSLLVKAMVKHGWPVKLEVIGQDGFRVKHINGSDELPSDVQQALDIAARICARTYRVEISQIENCVYLDRRYRVGAGGHFIKEK
jgi:hypothetical protein